MNKQDNQEPKNEQPQVEDLAINQDQAAEVNGGRKSDYSAVVFVGGWGGG